MIGRRSSTIDERAYEALLDVLDQLGLEVVVRRKGGDQHSEKWRFGGLPMQITSTEPDVALVIDGKMGVVGHFPEMIIGVGEIAGITAPLTVGKGGVIVRLINSTNRGPRK